MFAIGYRLDRLAVDPTDLEACKEHVARYPTNVLLLRAIGWWLSVFASCWLVTQPGANRHPAHGIVVGLILLSLYVGTMAMLPYPVWFSINQLAFPACAALGYGWDAARIRRNYAESARIELRIIPTGAEPRCNSSELRQSSIV